MHVFSARKWQRRSGGVLCVCWLEGTGITDDNPIAAGGSRGRIADPLGHHLVVNAWRGGGTGRPAPFEFVILRFPGEVTALAEGDLFVERVAGLEDFQIAGVKLAGHLEDL